MLDVQLKCRPTPCNLVYFANNNVRTKSVQGLMPCLQAPMKQLISLLSVTQMCRLCLPFKIPWGSCTPSHILDCHPHSPYRSTMIRNNPLSQPKAAKLAQNEALLNRIIAAQGMERRVTHDQDGSHHSGKDDPLMQYALRRKPAPRRSVTWVNETRWVYPHVQGLQSEGKHSHTILCHGPVVPVTLWVKAR